MVRKKEEYNEARKLRKTGYSLSEISNQLDVAKSSVSNWTKDISLSKKGRKRIESIKKQGREKAKEAKASKKQKSLLKAEKFGVDVVDAANLDKELKRLMCATMYWCEGSENGRRVAFSNSDPGLVKVFLSLFRESFSLDEEKFRIVMHLHSYHEEENQKRFWSDISGIPQTQFSKTYWKKRGGKRIRENYPGCILIRYNDVTILRRLVAIYKQFKQKGL